MAIRDWCCGNCGGFKVKVRCLGLKLFAKIPTNVVVVRLVTEGSGRKNRPFGAWAVINKGTDGSAIISTVIGVSSALDGCFLACNKGNHSGGYGLVLMDARARSFNVDIGARVHLRLRAKVGIVDEGVDCRVIGAR